jgi:hypothetical protein
MSDVATHEQKIIRLEAALARAEEELASRASRFSTDERHEAMLAAQRASERREKTLEQEAVRGAQAVAQARKAVASLRDELAAANRYIERLVALIEKGRALG